MNVGKYGSIAFSNYNQLLIINFICLKLGGENFLINSLLTFFPSHHTCLIKLTDVLKNFKHLTLPFKSMAHCVNSIVKPQKLLIMSNL